ncbi:MAG: DUF58 domain-containing protein [Herpetosiphon sp.]
MWFKTIFRRHHEAQALPAAAPAELDLRLLEHLDRIVLRTNRSLRGGLTGAHASRKQLPAPSVADHRPYTPGDDFRYVDWHAYARHEGLHIKMGESDQDARVTVLLDSSRSMDYGTGSSGKWLKARQVAATIAYCGLAQGDQVTLQLSTTPLTTPFQGRGRHRGIEMLRYLQGYTTGDATSMQEVLAQTGQRGRGGLLVVISDLWHVDRLDEALRMLPGPRWQVMVIHLLHRDELQPSLDGAYELEDSETGSVVPLAMDDRTRTEYHRRLAAWRADFERCCSGYNASYALITTDQSLEQALVPYLQARRILV